MKQKDLIILLVPALILTILWVIFNVYHSYVTSTIKDPLTYEIIPIEGNFDQNTINQIKGRGRVEPSYEIIENGSETPTPTPSLEPEQEGSSSGEVTPTPGEENQ